MSATFEKIEPNLNHSFYMRHIKVTSLPSPLHFHPEIEIILIVKGKGTRVVGNSVERFSPGDVVVIGENTPHGRFSDNITDKDSEESLYEAIYIQFNKDIFSESFWELPETKNINNLIKKSNMGLKLSGQTRENVSKLMNRILTTSGFDRIILLLSIFNIISLREEYSFLASSTEHHLIDQKDSDRLSKVYKYVIDNFSVEISIEEAASLASFSPNAFCRYFKTRTHKTFIQFLVEVRIGHACRLLVDENYSVSEIGYMCGFNNISYFIKQFREITSLTPLNYQAEGQLIII